MYSNSSSWPEKYGIICSHPRCMGLHAWKLKASECGTIFAQNCRVVIIVIFFYTKKWPLAVGSTVLVVRTCRTVNFA